MERGKDIKDLILLPRLHCFLLRITRSRNDKSRGGALVLTSHFVLPILSTVQCRTLI